MTPTLAHLAEVERAHAKLTALLDILRTTGGCYTNEADWQALETAEAMGLAFGLDTQVWEDQHRDALNIDAEGFRLDQYGYQTPDRVRVPLGRVA